VGSDPPGHHGPRPLETRQMSYVQHVLQPGETVRFSTKLHWINYLPGLVMLIAALAVYAVPYKMNTNGSILNIIAIILLAIAVVLLFIAWFRRWTTEIAVTSRRIIFKRGFIWRRTIEMQLDKVESVDVDQSILGRLLNYGNITVRGVGVGLEPLTTIAAPITFRNHVTAE
jgi:uncharacterized membrane protein YdbT with pleckstrin-like domain